MSVKTNLQNAIDKAVEYVDSLKTYTLAAQIIDNLIKAILINEKINELYISELEMTIQECDFNFKEKERLKKIISLFDGDDTLTFDEILFLEEVKERSQYYTGRTPREIITKYIVIDAYLQKYQPDKTTRPRNIEQIQKGFKLITEKYADKN